jgi:hypothetical protein
VGDTVVIVITFSFTFCLFVLLCFSSFSPLSLVCSALLCSLLLAGSAKSNMVASYLQLVIYNTDEEHKDYDVDGLCSEDANRVIKRSPWISYVSHSSSLFLF